MARIHTMEDDITFERVRHMPRRTRVCSMHRQLSWACQKEIQLYEKDTKVTTNNLERSKTAMQGRFRQLVKVRKELSGDKADLFSRRASCPAVLGENTVKTQLIKQFDLTKREHRDGPNADNESSGGLREIEKKGGDNQKGFPRSISMYEKPDSTDRTGSVSKPTDGKSSNRDNVRFERRQTMPAL